MKSYNSKNGDDSSSKNESNDIKNNNANSYEKIDLQKQHREWPPSFKNLRPVSSAEMGYTKYTKEDFESIPSRRKFCEDNFLNPLKKWYAESASKNKLAPIIKSIGAGKTHIYEFASADAIAIEAGKRMRISVSHTRFIRSTLSYHPLGKPKLGEVYREYMPTTDKIRVANITDTPSSSGSNVPNSHNTKTEAKIIVDELLKFAYYDDPSEVRFYTIASITPPVFEKVSHDIHEAIKKEGLTRQEANNIMSKLTIVIDEGDFGAGCGSDKPAARAANTGNASPSNSVLMNAALRFQNKTTEKDPKKKKSNKYVSTNLPLSEHLHDGSVVIELTATPSVNMKCDENGDYVKFDGNIGNYAFENADAYQILPPCGVSYEDVNKNWTKGFNSKLDMLDKQAPLRNAYYLDTIDGHNPEQFKPVLKEVIRQSLLEELEIKQKYKHHLFQFKSGTFIQFNADDSNPRTRKDPITGKKVAIVDKYEYGKDDIPFYGMSYSSGNQILKEITEELAEEGIFKELGMNNNSEFRCDFVEDHKPKHYYNSKNPEGIHTKTINGNVARTFKKDEEHEDLFRDFTNPKKDLRCMDYIQKFNRGVSCSNVNRVILLRPYYPDPRFPFGSAATIQSCRGSRPSIMFDYDEKTNTWAIDRYYGGDLKKMINDFSRRYGHTGITPDEFIDFIEDTNHFDMFMVRRTAKDIEDNQTKSFRELRNFHLNSQEEYSDFLNYMREEVRVNQTFVNQNKLKNQNGTYHEVDVLDAIGKILRIIKRKNVCVYYDKYDALVKSGYKFPASNVEFSKFPTENYREELYNLITKAPVARRFFDNKARTKYDTDIMITIDNKPVIIISAKCSLSDTLGSGGINNCSKLKKLLGIPVVLIQRNPISTDTDSVKSKAVFCSETSNLANIVAEDFAEMLDSVFLLNLHNDSLEIHPNHRDIAKPFYPFGEEFFKNLLG
jgi:hypothetical protein